MTENTTTYTSDEQQRHQKNVEGSNMIQETKCSSGTKTDSFDVQNNEEKTDETTQDSEYEEPKVSAGLKRKALTSPPEAKRKRSIEDQTLEESVLDLEDPKEKIKNLILDIDALKTKSICKDKLIEKLKVELDEKAEEIKKLLVINNRYKSGLVCSICTGYLTNPCTVNCGHSFCYFCLREWLNTNRENGSKCPSCRADIKTQPVLSFVVKDQIDVLVEQLSPEERKGFEKDDQKYKQITDPWAGMFIRPLHDEEDGVYRCPSCGWEVEDSICGNCSQHINVVNRDYDYEDNEDDNSEIENWGNESDTYDSNDSFIDDDSDLVDGPSLSPLNHPYDAIVINDSVSELSEEQSEFYNVEKKDNNPIVISSDEDEEKDSHSFNSNRSQPTSPLSNTSEPNEGPLHDCRNSISSNQDDESQENTKSFSVTEVEHAECNSNNSDGSKRVHD